jgi:hypothetical protein
LLPRFVGRMRGSVEWIEENELKRRIDDGELLAILDVVWIEHAVRARHLCDTRDH